MPRDPLDERLELPAHVVYVDWAMPGPAAVVSWDVEILADPGTRTGEYLALYNGSIDGSACYLGLQTDVYDPRRGTGIGKGLIFSTWWSFQRADTRVPAGGFIQLGTHEGRFVGVRRPYDWGVGRYRVTLGRAEAEAASGRWMDWFDLTVEALGESGRAPAPESMGGIRFPRRDSRVPASVEGGLAFMEVYARAATWRDVDRWDVRLTASADGVICGGHRVRYTDFPHGQWMPNVRASVLRGGTEVELEMGRGVEWR